MSCLLLDTCALIYLTTNDSEAGKVKAAIQAAYDIDQPVFVSAISAWEIGLLVARRRLNLIMSAQRLFDIILETSGVELAALSPEVLIASSFLPDAPWRDPGDRIMAATAREFGFTLLTRDRQLLAYAEKGHIRAMPC